MITVAACSFYYAKHFPVLRDINFSIERGALFLIAGINGSGKSTLLQLLAGLLSPNSGELKVDGKKADAQRLRSMAALCLQEPDLQIFGATPREDLELCLSRKADKTPIMEQAERFALTHCLDAPVHTLSHGQKRKLCLAAALLTQEQRCREHGALLLLDEPCSGLDYPAIIELRAILRNNRAHGVTQVVASHDLEPLADLADQMGLMTGGIMPHVGAPAAVLPHARNCGVRPPCGWRPGNAVTPWE